MHNILFIEDHLEDVSYILKFLYLNKIHYDVDFPPGAILSLLESYQYDIVIIDLMLYGVTDFTIFDVYVDTNGGFTAGQAYIKKVFRNPDSFYFDMYRSKPIIIISSNEPEAQTFKNELGNHHLFENIFWVDKKHGWQDIVIEYIKSMLGI